MNPEIFAEWFRLQGHRVVQTGSCFWVEVSPHIYQAFPYSWQIEPNPEELHQLFYYYNALGIRFSTKWDSSQGVASYHVVYKHTEYPLNDLPKKARHDVQKGLKSAKIEPISFARLADEGWPLRCDTLLRQGRKAAESPAWWRRLCMSAEELPGFEAWSAIVNGRLAAALLAFTCEDCCSILYQQSLTEYLPLGVNNALAFAFTNEVLNRPGKLWLFYGIHSLDAPASVDEFKFRMGYTAKSVRQRVVFHPLFRPLFNPSSHALLRGLMHMMPDNPSLAKAEGMVRFFLEGEKPLEQQSWPVPLVRQKEHILENL